MKHKEIEILPGVFVELDSDTCRSLGKRKPPKRPYKVRIIKRKSK